MKKPTQADVARLAGVSRATVSYVINNREAENAIPLETSSRVWSAVRELGYVPNQQAQHLKRQATNRICVVLPRLGIPSNDLMLDALRKYATAQDYSVIIAVGDTQERILQLMTQVRGGLADAVHLDLGYGSIRDIDQILEKIAGIAVPFIVSADVDPTSDYDVNWVTDEQASYEAIQYLVDKGHQRIAFVGHNIADVENYGRYRGYVRGLTENCISIHKSYVRPGLDLREQAHEATNDFLSLPEPPTAIFCTSDINAMTVISAAHHRGLRVPDDLAVIGCGNISEGRVFYPRLTTIGPQHYTFNDVAELIMHRLTQNDQLPPQKVWQKWQLIIRETT